MAIDNVEVPFAGVQVTVYESAISECVPVEIDLHIFIDPVFDSILLEKAIERFLRDSGFDSSLILRFSLPSGFGTGEDFSGLRNIARRPEPGAHTPDFHERRRLDRSSSDVTLHCQQRASQLLGSLARREFRFHDVPYISFTKASSNRCILRCMIGWRKGAKGGEREGRTDTGNKRDTRKPFNYESAALPLSYLGP